MTVDTPAQTGAPQGAPSESQPQASTPAPEQTKDPLASKFAALSQKDKAVRAQKQELKAEVSSLDADRGDLQAYRQFKERAKSNPMELLKHFGVEIDDIARWHAEDPVKREYEEKYQSLDKKVEERFKSLEEKEATQKAAEVEAKNQQHIDAFKTDLNKFIESNKDTYELIATTNQSETVFEVILEHYQNTNEIMPYETAAKLVEEHLESELDKVLSAKKIQGKFSPQASTPGTSKASPTLSSGMVPAAGNLDDLSDKERFQIAKQMLDKGIRK